MSLASVSTPAPSAKLAGRDEMSPLQCASGHMSDLNVRTRGGKDCGVVEPDCSFNLLGDAEIVMIIAFNSFHFPNKCLTNIAAWKNCRRRGSRPLSSDLQITKGLFSSFLSVVRESDPFRSRKMSA